jgi:hypothetical protein
VAAGVVAVVGAREQQRTPIFSLSTISQVYEYLI